MTRKFQFALVNPERFTDYNRTVPQLEAMLLFSALVAGKAAMPTARALDKLLNMAVQVGVRDAYSKHPFKVLAQPYFNIPRLATMLKACGIGCYNRKCITVHQIVRAGLNLRTCSIEDLEKIHGIGPKTARMFLLHSRPNMRVAVLDTHILKYLRDLGYDVPSSTPGSYRRYAELEQVCLQLSDEMGMSPADWDLSVWNYYRENKGGGKANKEEKPRSSTRNPVYRG